METCEVLERAFKNEDLLWLGVCSPEYPDDSNYFQQWISSQSADLLPYLKNHLEIRLSPGRLGVGFSTVLIFAWRYGPVSKEISTNPRVAKYAQYPDYHKSMRIRAERVVASLRDKIGFSAYRICVDTAPILERALAKQSRRGFIGKNTCYVLPGQGSFLCLGEIFIDKELKPDIPIRPDPKKHDPVVGGCGRCDRCQVKCPTGALDEAYRLDVQRCLSYWTIENRGIIPYEFWPYLKDYWFGCDLCQDVCPFNKNVKPSSYLNRLEYPPLEEVAVMDQRTYERWFGGTALTRAKRPGLIRNALIALYATKHERLPFVMAALKGCEESPIKETLSMIENAILTKS